MTIKTDFSNYILLGFLIICNIILQFLLRTNPVNSHVDFDLFNVTLNPGPPFFVPNTNPWWWCNVMNCSIDLDLAIWLQSVSWMPLVLFFNGTLVTTDTLLVLLFEAEAGDLGDLTFLGHISNELYYFDICFRNLLLS